MKGTKVLARVLPAVALAASLGNLDQVKAWSGCAYTCVPEGCLGIEGGHNFLMCAFDGLTCEVWSSFACDFFS
jgi:hypothetical protein